MKALVRFATYQCFGYLEQMRMIRLSHRTRGFLICLPFLSLSRVEQPVNMGQHLPNRAHGCSMGISHPIYPYLALGAQHGPTVLNLGCRDQSIMMLQWGRLCRLCELRLEEKTSLLSLFCFSSFVIGSYAWICVPVWLCLFWICGCLFKHFVAVEKYCNEFLQCFKTRKWETLLNNRITLLSKFQRESFISQKQKQRLHWLMHLNFYCKTQFVKQRSCCFRMSFSFWVQALQISKERSVGQGQHRSLGCSRLSSLVLTWGKGLERISRSCLSWKSHGFSSLTEH